MSIMTFSPTQKYQIEHDKNSEADLTRFEEAELRSKEEKSTKNKQ